MENLRRVAAAAAVGAIGASALAGDPWANRVVEYVEGAGVPPGYNDPATAIGSPERFTGEGAFPSVVSPFGGPYGADEIVTIGEGGRLVVAFDEPVRNDPLNPFGVDLLIFGNSFYAYETGGLAGPASTEGGIIEVSPDGMNWTLIDGVEADGVYPTLGYLDITDPFQTTPGSVLSDFTRPVDPSFDATGLSLSEIIAGYDGSGGGAGIDIGLFGLDAISFVRITNPAGSGLTPEIDAFADVAPVPAPATVVALLGAGAFCTRRWRAPSR
ncbi:MAG: hypothetical protein ACF8R7_16940 [Phycisphaerales bacterium JB039]